MASRDSTIRTSKFLSYVLRHRPDAIGIELDENGWTSIDILIEKAAADGKSIDRALLEQVVSTNDKQRFAISDDGLRIRASQGHSVEIELTIKLRNRLNCSITAL